MKKKQIARLVKASYSSNNILDEKNTLKIASLLSKKDLRVYIKQIKNSEQKKTVKITLPVSYRNTIDKKFSLVFKNKMIQYDFDKSLLLGAKITDNDVVYDISLKGILENIASFVAE